MSARDQITLESAPALIGRAARDFVGRTRSAALYIRRHPLRPVVWALGLVHRDFVQFARWTLTNVLPDEATDDRLESQAGLYGLTPTAAVAATSTQLRFSGVAATAIPASTVVVRADGVTYTTDVLTAIGGGGTVDVAATCTLPSPTQPATGALGNLGAGGMVTLETPIAGITDEAVTVDGFAGGADQESTEALRTRVLARIRDEPDGGTLADYTAWVTDALLLPGYTALFDARVAAVWTVPGAGLLNYRDVYFIVTGPDPVPTAFQLVWVQAAIDAVRPVTHAVTVRTVAASNVSLTIELDPTPGDPDTSTVPIREAVTAELAALFARVAGRRDATGQLDITNSELRNAIGRGAAIFTLDDVDGDATGLSDVSFTAAQIPAAAIVWA